MNSTAILVALCFAIPAVAGERIHRSAAEVLAFKRENPCPSTGLRRGKCLGYVVDHINPLACGGPDHRSNMQWQTIADAKEKDKWERRTCKKEYRQPPVTLPINP